MAAEEPRRGARDCAASARVGARDNNNLIGTGINRGLDATDHLIHRGDFPARFMAAFLRPELIFDLSCANAGALKFAHRAHDVERSAITRVGVGNYGNRHHVRNAAHAIENFTER